MDDATPELDTRMEKLVRRADQISFSVSRLKEFDSIYSPTLSEVGYYLSDICNLCKAVRDLRCFAYLYDTSIERFMSFAEIFSCISLRPKLTSFIIGKNAEAITSAKVEVHFSLISFSELQIFRNSNWVDIKEESLTNKTVQFNFETDLVDPLTFFDYFSKVIRLSLFILEEENTKANEEIAFTTIESFFTRIEHAMVLKLNLFENTSIEYIYPEPSVGTLWKLKDDIYRVEYIGKNFIEMDKQSLEMVVFTKEGSGECYCIDLKTWGKTFIPYKKPISRTEPLPLSESEAALIIQKMTEGSVWCIENSSYVQIVEVRHNEQKEKVLEICDISGEHHREVSIDAFLKLNPINKDLS